MALSPAVCLLHFLLFYLHAKKNSLLMVRKHGNYLKAVAKKKARMGVLLIQADSH